MAIQLMQLGGSVPTIRILADELLASTHMAELQIVEDLASQPAKEGECPMLSLAAFSGGFAPSSAHMMDAEALTEPSKRGHGKLSTKSLMAMTCGIGGYVTNRSDSDALTTNLSLQITSSMVRNLFPRLILPFFSRYIHNSVVSHMGSRANLWLKHSTCDGCHQ